MFRTTTTMSYTLSEQEKSLLSAFHDGEATATEAAQARQLLERLPEARAWLRDARSVGRMSVEATMRVPLPALSGKLTGTAIVTAATKQGALSGGGFFAAARSPLGLAGAAAVLIAGAIWTFQELKNPVESHSNTELRVPSPETTSAIADAAMTDAFPQPDENALMVPPITARDLVGFALEGTLPINAERTQFVGMESGTAQEPTLAQEIEGGMETLKPLQVRALDSLGKLVRSSMVRLQGRGWAVRSDLPDLRLAVIDQLQKARLSGTARKGLTAACREAQENRTQLLGRLESEISGMEARLLAAGEAPYVLIETNATVENPTGSRNNVAVLKMIGERNRIITLNPQAIRISEPNPSLAFAAEPTRKERPAPAQQKAISPGTERDKPSAVSVDTGWEWIAAEPFMQSVTINIFSNEGVSVIISDEVDTTWQSPTLYIRNDIYFLGTRIDTLTDKLNEQISRIVNDRSKSPEVRAWEIMKERREYREQLEELLDSANRVKKDSPQFFPNDSLKKRNDPLEEAAEHDGFREERPLESTCMPWEDCTGVG